MSALLVPMDPERIPGWHAAGDAEYVRSRVAAGEPQALAEANAALWSERLFPNGVAGEGQLVFDIVADGNTVGTLWIGRQWDTPPDRWWVWDIEIDAAHRGRGFGRTAMELAEVTAREAGASVLGLNVFGYNTVARTLYLDLDYREVSISMEKTL